METVNAMTSIGRTFFVFGAQVGFVKQVKFLHWLKTLKYKPWSYLKNAVEVVQPGLPAWLHSEDSSFQAHLSLDVCWGFMLSFQDI